MIKVLALLDEIKSGPARNARDKAWREMAVSVGTIQYLCEISQDQDAVIAKLEEALRLAVDAVKKAHETYGNQHYLWVLTEIEKILSEEDS